MTEPCLFLLCEVFCCDKFTRIATEPVSTIEIPCLYGVLRVTLTCSSLQNEAAFAEKPVFEGFTSSKHSPIPMSPAIALDSFVTADMPQKTTKVHHEIPAIEEPFELRTVEDFAKIADEEGRIYVLGFGSLMSGKNYVNLRKISGRHVLCDCYAFTHSIFSQLQRRVLASPSPIYASSPPLACVGSDECMPTLQEGSSRGV